LWRNAQKRHKKKFFLAPPLIRSGRRRGGGEGGGGLRSPTAKTQLEPRDTLFPNLGPLAFLCFLPKLAQSPKGVQKHPHRT
jgi:hypothetical protein